MDNSCNPQKTITADNHKNDKLKGQKNEKSIFAKTTCMTDYVKPSVWSSPDHFILHVSTNDVLSDKLSEEIARLIIDLATSIKNEKHDVSISNIIIRADGKKLEKKRCEVNSYLGKLCKEKKYYLIDHSTRIKRKLPLKQRKVTFK